MSEEDKWITRKTLLLRAVNPNDEQAWNDFLDYYGRFIYYIILKMGVSSSSSDDIAQQIVLKLWKKLNTYDSTKGSFRPWLSTVIRNAVNEFYRKENRRKEDHYVEDVNGLVASKNDLDSMIQDEWEAYLTKEALENVKQVFSGKAVDAFILSLEGIKNDEIAERLDITSSSVRVLKSRVKSCFINEMKKLIEKMER